MYKKIFKAIRQQEYRVRILLKNGGYPFFYCMQNPKLHCFLLWKPLTLNLTIFDLQIKETVINGLENMGGKMNEDFFYICAQCVY